MKFKRDASGAVKLTVGNVMWTEITLVNVLIQVRLPWCQDDAMK